MYKLNIKRPGYTLKKNRYQRHFKESFGKGKDFNKKYMNKEDLKQKSN